MTDTDEKFMDELKEEFMGQVATNLKEMQNLFAENKFGEIAKIAHDIKGMSGIFQLDEGTEIAMQLQFAARDKEVEKTKQFIEKLTRYMKENGVIE